MKGLLFADTVNSSPYLGLVLAVAVFCSVKVSWILFFPIFSEVVYVMIYFSPFPNLGRLESTAFFPFLSASQFTSESTVLVSSALHNSTLATLLSNSDPFPEGLSSSAK